MAPFPAFLRFALIASASSWALAAPERVKDELAEGMVLTPQGGGSPEDQEIQRWQQRLQGEGDRADVWERLGWAYVAKARRTLDAGYYKLAEKTADAMDARFGPTTGARLLRGHVMHNLHRFRDAESIARDLVKERGAPADYALLSDALMEQGRLTEAVETLQRMVNLKPGPEAYSRIAHVRWLKGDLPGAIAMMEDAVRAVSPSDVEPYAWMLSRLSYFYLQVGQAPRALAVAESAEKSTPAYPPALIARGRALLVLGQVNAAIAVLERATELNPLPEYQWWLADALRVGGRGAEAEKMELAIKSRGALSDPRTLALFLGTRHENATMAVGLAREELGNRGDVFTHDALAWAFAASGDFAAADAEMQVALAEQTKDARLFFHAGEIALGRGKIESAGEFFRQAQSLENVLTPSERALLVRRLATGAVISQAN